MMVLPIYLTEADLGAICDALKWNVAKQKWLKTAWRCPVAREGHRLRQAQAEALLIRLETIWKDKKAQDEQEEG